MSVDPTIFKVRFPEFASEDDARIQLFLDDAIIILNEPHWGTKYDLGLSYLTAHYLWVANKTAVGSSSGVGAGPVTGRTVDGTSVSYGTAIAKDQRESDLSRTAYGQRYLSLLKTLPVAVISV